MNIVEIAEDTLVKAGACRLPVRPTKLAKVHNIAVYTYNDYARLGGITVGEIAARYGTDGFSVRFGNRYAICHNFSGNITRSRFTLAHELAHILLGHFTDESNLKISPECEKAANHLAIELLAPNAVLGQIEGLNTQKAADLCDISLTAARLQLRSEYRRYDNKNSTVQLLCSFQDFIDRQNEIFLQSGEVVNTPRARAHRL